MAIGGRAGETFTEINVTPLTDVFLVLLVIMILIAPLMNQTVLKVDAPAPGPSTARAEPEKNQIDVVVTSAGVVKVNGEVVVADSLAIQTAIKREQRKAGRDDLTLHLRSEGGARQKHVVAVMDAAAGANITKMQVLPLSN